MDNIPASAVTAESPRPGPAARCRRKTRLPGRRVAVTCLFLTLMGLVLPSAATAQQASTRLSTTSRVAGQDATRIPFIDLTVRNPQNNQEVALSVQLLLVLAVLTLAPSFIVMVTAFLRVSIVLDFVKRALSLQSVPPTQVLLGISLFLTVFIMWPTFTKIYDEAYKPFSEGTIGIEQAYSKFEGPLRVFMYKQMRNNPESIQLFMRMANLPKPKTLADVPTYALVPAFILNELTVAFKIGILLFIPFIIIDMVVSSVLMSMGMMMLPPVMISMPFKLILFVLVDGWTLLTQQLVASFA
jgi:flagellar biosynthetic protein FliP